MSRTWKDRKGYKTKHRSYGAMSFYNSRGSYEDYDHSVQEFNVYDQNCDNCRYRGCCCHEPYPSEWCEYWEDGSY